MILLFKIALKCSAEVLSGVPKCSKVVVCLWGKCALSKFCSGMSYDDGGYKVNVNQQCILNKVL